MGYDALSGFEPDRGSGPDGIRPDQSESSSKPYLEAPDTGKQACESWPTHRIHPYSWRVHDELIPAKGCVQLVVRGAGITSLRRRVELRPRVRLRPKGRPSIARFIRSCIHCTNA